ncbi:uncharacterized protein [Gossypium hirsutum]|uniref:Tf2-1-like SH3-like domain-containing protein n=1 Tax=Gossypium hirsutum TaxID=3635 RepID=A0A1U8KX73_GOSHI|nr:uncharacterized protein LOC107921676 [Gossypium hirsutum]
MAYQPQTDGQSDRVIQVLEDMLRSYVIKFNGRKCRTPLCWVELDEKVIGPELVRETKEKVKIICKRLKAATNRKKSYVDLKHQDIKFQAGDKVFLKVSPWKKVLRFGRKGKFSPKYVGSYEVVERIGLVAYRLKLRPKLQRIHDVFHVFIPQKCCSNLSHIAPVEEIEVRLHLTYDEEPMEILAHKEKVLRNKRVPLVKVLWCNHKTE